MHIKATHIVKATHVHNLYKYMFIGAVCSKLFPNNDVQLARVRDHYLSKTSVWIIGAI